MNKILMLMIFVALPVLADSTTPAPTPTPEVVTTTEADQFVTNGAEEVRKAGVAMKEALNKAAKKIEKTIATKATPAADNTPKGADQSTTTKP